MSHLFLGHVADTDQITPTSDEVTMSLPGMLHHGIISGATGSGKTTTLTRMVSVLSQQGVPSFLADVKGDLIPALRETGVPLRVLSMDPASVARGEAERFSIPVSSVDTRLLARLIDLSDVQEETVSIMLRFFAGQTATNNLNLFGSEDLDDLLRLFNEVRDEPALKVALKAANAGNLTGNTLGTIQRKVANWMLRNESASGLFGTTGAFDAKSLFAHKDGMGVVTVLDFTAAHRAPAAAALALLTVMQQVGEICRDEHDHAPRLALFIEEAHAIFSGGGKTAKAVTKDVTHAIKTWRSKGVSLWFVSQEAGDIPEAILGQVGNRIQHSIRVNTADQWREVRGLSKAFPGGLSADVVENNVLTMPTGTALFVGQESVLPDVDVKILGWGQAKVIRVSLPEDVRKPKTKTKGRRNFDAMNRDDLRKAAKEVGVKGASKMPKDALLAAVKAAA